MRAEPRQIAERLGLAPVFRGLDAETLRAVAGRGVFRTLRRGTVLWRQGAFAHELAFVWTGALSVQRNLEGHISYRVVGQNDLIGFSNAIGGAPCTVDVVAHEESRLFLVPGDELRALVPRHPEIAFRALAYLGELVGRLSDQVELLHRGDVRTRLVVSLRTLAGPLREVNITHQKLADHIGAKRETVTRALGELERQGVLRCARGRVELLRGGT